MDILKLKDFVDNEKISSYQKFVVFFCFILYIIDGFDFMIMAYLASSVANEFSLTGTNIGTLISAGLIGMTVCSFLLAPLADKIGRRNLINLCLLICGLSMFASAFATDFKQLVLCRFLTGVGIGGVQISAMILASEYSPTKYKSFSVGILSAGYGIGAISGALLAVYSLESIGWRQVFLIGGFVTTFAFLCSLKFLPESIDYLLIKQPKHALEKLNQIFSKMHKKPILTLPKAYVKNQKSSYVEIFNHKYLVKSLVLWVSIFFILFGFYFVMGWTPKILNSSGLDNSLSIKTAMMISVGGILGSFIIGVLSSKVSVYINQIAFLILTYVCILLFVNNTDNLNILIIVATTLGFFINGCLAGIYAISTQLYEADVRSTGVGIATGVGRFGGIFSPIIAGYFLDLGNSPLELYGNFGFAFVLAAIAIFIIYKLKQKSVVNTPYVVLQKEPQ